MWIVIFIAMIFCHIVDDYYLQGCLAKFKQKQWWKDNVKDNYDLYKYDYIIALITHAFSWSVMIHIPLIVYMFYNNYITDSMLVLTILINTAIHARVDNLKANELAINLIIDQLLHLVQIVLTFMMYACIFGAF